MTPLVALLKEVGRFPKSLLVHALEQFGVLSFLGGGDCLVSKYFGVILSSLKTFCRNCVSFPGNTDISLLTLVSSLSLLLLFICLLEKTFLKV